MEYKVRLIIRRGPHKEAKAFRKAVGFWCVKFYNERSTRDITRKSYCNFHLYECCAYCSIESQVSREMRFGELNIV